MGSDEEYLDNLLKSVSGDASERKAMTEDDIAALFANAETPQEEPNIDTLLNDLMALNESASDFDVDFADKEENYADINDSDNDTIFEDTPIFDAFAGGHEGELSLDDAIAALDAKLEADLSLDESIAEFGSEFGVENNDMDELLAALNFGDDTTDALGDVPTDTLGDASTETEENVDSEISLAERLLNFESGLDSIFSMEDSVETGETETEFPVEETPSNEEFIGAVADGELLNEDEVQTLLERDADLFGDVEDQSDLVDLESLEIDEEFAEELIEAPLPVEVVEVPDTEEIEQSDMLDIASMFDSDEDLTEGVSYDTTGFYDDEPSEDDFNPFGDMSDIDDLLKAVNWEPKEEEGEATDAFADASFGDGAQLDTFDGFALEDTEESVDDSFALTEDAETFDNFENVEDDVASTEETDFFGNDIDLDVLGESEDADMAELGALLKLADGEGDAADLLGEIPDDGPTAMAILHGEEESPQERKARIKAEKAAAKELKKSQKAAAKAEKAAKKALKEVEDMPEPKYKKVAIEETEQSAEKPEKAAKSGIFSKIINALLEEDIEEEEEKKSKKKHEEEVIELDENGTIPEDVEQKTKIKEKKVKPKKEKKEKPKKEKKVKEKKESSFDFEEPVKIRKASIKIVFGFAASVLALVVLGNYVIEPILSKYNAKKAFTEQQYEECYQLLSGQKLSEEEQLMLDHASVVLKINRRIVQHDEYMNYKDKLHALNILFDAVSNYDDWYQEALNCGAKAEVESAYIQILMLLESYGVSETQAKTIVRLDDVAYTRVVTALAENEAFEEYIQPGANQGEIKDLLPGEMD